MLTWQELEQLVKTLKGRQREQAAFAIAALCFPSGYAVSEKLLPEWKDGLTWREGLQLALYAIGAVALLYAFVRLWRLTHVPKLPPVKDRPSVIKGPSAFTPGDGELFRRLGRENELQELMGYVLDNQVPLVILMGESGAGKTSLLRAGLPHILKSEGVRVHYWEAVPTDSAERLLRAIQEDWQVQAANGAAASGIPASLDELVNPAAALGMEQHVIVLDQFEQLRGRNPVFQLLRRVAREARPPHRITWVIAFRREYRADWSDFIIPEQKRGFFPKEISMRLFTTEQARDVISQLIQEADLSVEPAVFANLIEAATNDRGEVVPVDIGIGLLVLAELHDRQGARTVTIRDYQFAGGAEGLLTQYINRCLERFGETERETILKALLALRDPQTSQRIAEGLSAEKLAAEVDAEARQLRPQLERLAQRDMRLLESFSAPAEPPATSEVRYRLPHERLIPALHRLTGRLLGEIEQARLRFEKAFLAWQNNEKRAHYLLKGADLRLIERCASQIPWGRAEQEKQSFLRQSQRRRSFVRVRAVAAAIVLIAFGWGSGLIYQQYEHKRYLRESGYPPELYAWQHQLKKLKLTEPLDLERFTWLSSDSIEELSLKAATSSNSIAGLISLARCNSLKKLTLDLSLSQVGNLEPLAKLSNLTQLTLVLGDSQVSNLEPLAKLSNWTQLTLDLSRSQVGNLEPLAKLSNLTQLMLSLSETHVSNLEPLAKLSNLTQLTLVLGGRQISNLEPLAKLSNLTQLTLALRDSQISNLEPLAKLSNLTQLALVLSGRQISNLEPLAKLSNLTQLALDLRNSQVSNLEPLAKLSNLTQLGLDLSFSQVSNLEPLTKLSNLTQLAFDLSRSQVSNLEPLAKLSNRTQLELDLSFSQVSNLEPLAKLSNLTQLALDLRFSQVSNLEPLAKLSDLTQLTLDLSGSQVSNLEPLAKLSDLTQLALDLRNSQVSNLEPLAKLSNLTQLALDLVNSQISNSEPLVKLTRLRSLSIESATRAQRMSLQKIPASLIELKF